MASRKLQVLDVIRRYFARWGRSPSYGEIAGELGVSSETVKGHVRALEREGELSRGGRRGLKLPDRAGEMGDAEIMRLARERGLIAALASYPLPNSTLPVPVELEHIPDVDIGGSGHATHTDEAA